MAIGQAILGMLQKRCLSSTTRMLYRLEQRPIRQLAVLNSLCMMIWSPWIYTEKDHCRWAIRSLGDVAVRIEDHQETCLSSILFTAIRLSPGIAVGRLHRWGSCAGLLTLLARPSRDSESCTVPWHFLQRFRTTNMWLPRCIWVSKSPVPAFASDTIGPRR
jgi:hypothetical protein